MKTATAITLTLAIGLSPLAQLPAAQADTRGVLEGHWRTACETDDFGAVQSTLFYHGEIIFTDKSFTFSDSTFADAECTVATATELTTGSFTVVDERAFDGATVVKVDLVASTMTQTLHTKTAVESANAYKDCGVENWSIDTPQDISQCTDDSSIELPARGQDIFLLQSDKLLGADVDAQITELTSMDIGDFDDEWPYIRIQP